MLKSLTNNYYYVFYFVSGGNHSNKEVIDAYRNTCSRLKIKPCEKLIKQLEVNYWYIHTEKWFEDKNNILII